MPITTSKHTKTTHGGLILFTSSLLFLQANCLYFNFPSFNRTPDLMLSDQANIAFGSLQVTEEARGAASIANLSGRILHRKRFKLWSKRRNKIGSFNTTFIFNITPQSDPGGDGIAFVLSDVIDVPDNGYGQWLGIVNPKTNGSSSNGIVAVEFDTKKSFAEDLDDNHVGVDVNSVYSLIQVSMNRYGVNISSAENVTAVINYNGTEKTLKVFVHYSNDSATSGGGTESPVISIPLDLSDFLSESVYVGFSGSTGNSTELNCLKSWIFDGDDVVSPVPVWIWAVVAIAGAVLASAIAGLAYWWMKSAREGDEEDEYTVDREIEISKIGPKKYRLKELRSATGNFDEKNMLGRGGFGIVYRGKLNSEQVAVKRILKNNQQGRKNLVAEVTTIGSLHHKNLVKLTGWCNEKRELLLVYEYMPNGSLDKVLYTESGLSWEKRRRIVCGVAQAVDYLHTECSRRVLHRDIKASNIMLDSDFNACLGDFGLARMFNVGEKTHHTTRELAGTPGYMAPEIFHTGKATAETDVYAYGVLTLVVVSGRRPVVQINSDGYQLSYTVVDWVWELYKMDMILSAVDPKMEKCYDKGEAECMLVMGLACCHPNPHMRISMKSALQVLMGESGPPLVPYEKPAYVWPASAPLLSEELDRSSTGMTMSSFSSFSGR